MYSLLIQSCSTLTSKNLDINKRSLKFLYGQLNSLVNVPTFQLDALVIFKANVRPGVNIVIYRLT